MTVIYQRNDDGNNVKTDRRGEKSFATTVLLAIWYKYQEIHASPE
jgi:hypothetical protein